jgi:hypothetical protein
MMDEIIPLNVEPEQEYFLQAMRDLGFTEQQIEENRQYHGKLFLTPAVVIGMIRGFGTGIKVNTVKGDLVKA